VPSSLRTACIGNGAYASGDLKGRWWTIVPVTVPSGAASRSSTPGVVKCTTAAEGSAAANRWVVPGSSGGPCPAATARNIT
jgi:hypothetical protein